MKLLLDRPAFEALRARMRGAVIDPADPEYDIARRVHNGMIDKRPAAIAAAPAWPTRWWRSSSASTRAYP
jgi:hypothetical protein